MNNFPSRPNESASDSLPPGQQDRIRLQAIFREERRRKYAGTMTTYFPETGPLRRNLYQKHLAFFRAGAVHRERLMLAANRVGKTETAGGFETALHVTGRYPEWWEGRRFDGPVSFIAAGDTSKNVREIIQRKLFGPIKEIGTGLIPQECIIRTTPKHGIADAFDTVFIQHESGGTSELVLKSYDQGVEAFYGTERHGAWLDEEPPQEIVTECVMRTMTTNGIVYLTFMPLNGRTALVNDFLTTCVNREELEYQ